MSEIRLGNTPFTTQSSPPQGAYVDLEGDYYYRIRHVDQMPPFFMSIVSGSDHWLFIASNGGVTAGRTNSESALFPYETEDKLMAHSDTVGSSTIVRVKRGDQWHLWEPFTNRGVGLYRTERNLYKNVSGNKLIFEEINDDLLLTWRTSWRTGDQFGFIKTTTLHNDGDQTTLELLDGLLNILPFGATSALQANFSNLLNAYKRAELDPETGLAIYALSATLTDQAEPSESLQATAVWQIGLSQPNILLSTNQVENFRRGLPIATEQDVLGRPGAYLINTALTLKTGQGRSWSIGADVNQDIAAITRLSRLLLQGQDKTATGNLTHLLEDDIAAGDAALLNRVAAADGFQISAAQATTAHHFANVLFNVMRGGVFKDGYQIDKRDLLDFVATRNRPILDHFASWFETLPESSDVLTLARMARASGSADLQRLCAEYLPLTFSRRHGDPSRPWNNFSINLKRPDGSPRLDYQGNWRDIFQNWEPLLISFPAYIPGVIAKFLNATTVDGYNPYRVTRSGIEWEVPEPDNPWSNIGYWSDHQIIYLQKLLELSEQVDPGSLPLMWTQPLFTYANVPYRLRPYDEMLDDWSNTIDFDWEREKMVADAVAAMGTDGRLLHTAVGQVIHVNMAEKMLVLLLAKLVNLVPEGGIWMNTQRPEWNDANNALVGKGLSVVTAAYLRRFVVFWRRLLESHEEAIFPLNTALADLLDDVHQIFSRFATHLDRSFDPPLRRQFMDALGAAATRYRAIAYDQGLPDQQRAVTAQTVIDLLALAQTYLAHTLHANRRPDGLFHAYNILGIEDGRATIDHLYLMLEGQVAILSSDLLTPAEALSVVSSLRHSNLYRADQHSYMLYPNRQLPGFRQKNQIPAARLADSPLQKSLTAAGDRRLFVRDELGDFHFNGRFRNSADVDDVLDTLATEPAYTHLAAAERQPILDLFEETFNHQAFTGRSGTFFAYEGLGSVYWHMVSKLLLAVQENLQLAIAQQAPASVIDGLREAYYDVRQGIGFNKSPADYGAFPADPYSHTPLGGGARQPGMTGQVKEEILTRWGELGVIISEGALRFAPSFLMAAEFSPSPTRFAYIGLADRRQTIDLPAGSLAFTFCQIPIVYTVGDTAQTIIEWATGQKEIISGTHLDRATSQHLFERDGLIRQITVSLDHGFA